jgi:hypothetical protein
MTIRLPTSPAALSRAETARRGVLTVSLKRSRRWADAGSLARRVEHWRLDFIALTASLCRADSPARRRGRIDHTRSTSLDVFADMLKRHVVTVIVGDCLTEHVVAVLANLAKRQW